VAKIFRQNWTVQGTDFPDIQRTCYFQELLYLQTVFSDNTDKITACFVIPWFLAVECTEFSKTVCCEQNLVRAVVCNHNLRPVYHRSEYEGQNVFSKRKGLAILYFQFLSGEIHLGEKVFHHGKGFCVCNNGCFRICFYEVFNIRRVIRLHMLHDQVIRFSAIQCFRNICQPFIRKVCIYGIHNCRFFIENYVRIVCHAVRHSVLTFKKVYLMIVDSRVDNILCNLHKNPYPFHLVFSCPEPAPNRIFLYYPMMEKKASKNSKDYYFYLLSSVYTHDIPFPQLANHHNTSILQACSFVSLS